MEDEREFQDLDLRGMESILDRYQWNEELVGRLQVELARRRDASPAARKLLSRLNALPGVRAAQRPLTDPVEPDKGSGIASPRSRPLYGSGADVATIRPVGTPGLPSVFPKKLEDDLSLPIAVDAPLCERYRAALQAYIEERRSSKNGKTLDIYEGRRTRSLGNSGIYTFKISRTDDLLEGAEVELQLEGESSPCKVAAITPTDIELIIGSDIGWEVPKARLRLDDNKLLERLRDRLQAIESNEREFNKSLADATLGVGTPASVRALQEISSGPTLNTSQRAAVRHALSHAVTYIWGPPGCGKTLTLGEIVRTMFEAGKRTLICSNTNKAVDQVFYSICKALGRSHTALQSGQIIRLGKVADPKLKEEFGDDVDLDRVVARLTEDFQRKLNEVKLSISSIESEIEPIRDVLGRFESLDAASARLESVIANLGKIKKRAEEIRQDIAAQNDTLSELAVELSGKRGWVRRLFPRPSEQVTQEIREAEALRSHLEAQQKQSAEAKSDADRLYMDVFHDRSKLMGSLTDQDRPALQQQHDARSGELNALRGEREKIENEIADLRAKILGHARVVGATGTRVYLTPKDIGLLDLVIVDEASMLLQPVIWMAAGLSRERTVICGDFRQISPIMTSDQRVLFDLLGRDVFRAAGVSALDSADARMVMLDTQYRMDEQICALISQRMYGGRLRTATDPSWLTKRQQRARPPAPFDHALTLIDTSDLPPGEAIADRSRFNPIHALLIRNLAHHLTQTGFAKQNTDLAVCTPYVAQKNLIEKVLHEAEMRHVEVGTVHAFQGDERKAVIVDFPESPGRDIGFFLKGIHPDDEGSRLVNVAVSRTQSHLIVLANLRHLDARLPSQSIVRGILSDMQAKGRVLPAAQLLKLGPREGDLAGLEGVELNEAAQQQGIFDSTTFDRAFTADIARARKSIVIFSGFVSHLRVGELQEAFREAIRDEVRVRCVSRPPTKNLPNPAIGSKAFDALEKIGCAVDGRARIHQKVILIDERIVWNGSLNVLSFARGTDELMMRTVSREIARASAMMLAKRPTTWEKALEDAWKAENPRCAQCGSRTYYDKTVSQKLIFECEQRCGERKKLPLSNDSAHTQPDTDSGGDAQEASSDEQMEPTPVSYLETAKPPYRKWGPPCPLCNSDTRLRRNGTTGARFYGCGRYPTCRGNWSIPAEDRGGRVAG